MGVIKRFAIGSMVLGVLAIAGGTSALAFDGGSGKSPATAPIQAAPAFAEASDVRSDVPADEPTAVLPDTGGDSAASRWISLNGR